MQFFISNTSERVQYHISTSGVAPLGGVGGVRLRLSQVLATVVPPPWLAPKPARFPVWRWSLARISRRTALGVFGAPLYLAMSQEAGAARARIPLNGVWRWKPEGAGTWSSIAIPESWPRSVQAIAAAYEREVTIPAAWSGRRITLSADCINSYAAAYVDGAKAGEMRYPAGEVDLTPWLRPGHTHLLSMQVIAMPLKAVMLSYSDSASAKTVEGTVARRGITGDVCLNAMPAGPRISGVAVETSVRKWEITVEAELSGLDARTPYRLIARIYDGRRLVKEFAGAGQRFSEAWRPEKLWDIHTPQNQCDLSLTLADANGAELDTAFPVRFGFRELWIDGRDFRLNGSRICLSATPLDNAQTSVASAGYEATRATLQRFKSFGVNFVYTHNYGCEPGTHYSFEEVLRAADDEGILLAFSQPHFGQYDWTAADADTANGYAQHAAFYVRVARNHPSVVFYSTSHNGAGYSEDMNPDLIDGVNEPREQWSARGAERARRAEAIIRRLDGSRIVYHHAGGNLNAMYTVNFYGNWIPPQEMDEWFEHWATAGVKPLFTCEYSVPFLWDWSMYRGWYKGKREFGSAVVPWEFHVAEWDSQFLGDRAYRITEAERANLRWEAEQFRKGSERVAARGLPVQPQLARVRGPDCGLCRARSSRTGALSGRGDFRPTEHRGTSRTTGRKRESDRRGRGPAPVQHAAVGVHRRKAGGLHQQGPQLPAGREGGKAAHGHQQLARERHGKLRLAVRRRVVNRQREQ